MEQDLLLQKYLNGSLTPEETAAFKVRPDYVFNKMLLDDAQVFKASSFSEATDFESLKVKLPLKTTSSSSFIKPMMRYAAIGFLAVASYFLFFYNQATTINTQLAEQTTIQLPDASSVTLNALSSIKYHADNWSDERTLDLKGEAYFKVAKGSTFDVVTEHGVVRVLGTQFSIKQRESYFEVQCFEGKVAVIGLNKKVELLPGRAFRIVAGKSEEFTFNKEEPSWILDRSSFINVPLSEVLAEFERHYLVVFDSKKIDTQILFHGVFVHDSLENALIQITLPLSLTYVISQDNTVILSKRE